MKSALRVLLEVAVGLAACLALAPSVQADDVIVRLPGPDPAPVAVPEPRRLAPPELPPPVLLASARPDVRRLGPPIEPLKLELPKPLYPEEMAKDSAIYLQRHLGDWTEQDARRVLGETTRRRFAIDEQRNPDGTILAFADPTGHYREVELDFEKESGRLRTVFLYPWKLTWTECRRRWGAKVESATAQNGRVFHSYSDRRLDVLVDARGQVVSLGLY
jgi:hypothetical protein